MQDVNSNLPWQELVYVAGRLKEEEVKGKELQKQLQRLYQRQQKPQAAARNKKPSRPHRHQPNSLATSQAEAYARQYGLYGY